MALCTALILTALIVAGMWLICYRIFVKSSNVDLKIIVFTLALLLCIPAVYRFSNDLTNGVSYLFFMHAENGEIRYDYSPLKIPKGKAADEYCNQFTLANGSHEIPIVTSESGESYCGITPRKLYVKLLPYRLLGKKKAMYWIGAYMTLIGPAPDPEHVGELQKSMN